MCVSANGRGWLSVCVGAVSVHDCLCVCVHVCVCVALPFLLSPGPLCRNESVMFPTLPAPSVPSSKSLHTAWPSLPNVVAGPESLSVSAGGCVRSST